MSIGKKSIARAAATAAKTEAAAEEVLPVAEIKPQELDEAPVKKVENKIPEKFKKVSVGDKMPAFLL